MAARDGMQRPRDSAAAFPMSSQDGELLVSSSSFFFSFCCVVDGRGARQRRCEDGGASVVSRGLDCGGVGSDHAMRVWLGACWLGLVQAGSVRAAEVRLGGGLGLAAEVRLAWEEQQLQCSAVGAWPGTSSTDQKRPVDRTRA